jgi:hypothetical protein
VHPSCQTLGVNSLPTMNQRTEPASTVKLPLILWQAMQVELIRPQVVSSHTRASNNANERWPKPVSLRLTDGTIKRWVEVNQAGEAVSEEYEEFGPRAERFGLPRFTTSEVESWGFMERKWRPRLNAWFGVSWSWRVLASVNGKARE